MTDQEEKKKYLSANIDMGQSEKIFKPLNSPEKDSDQSVHRHDINPYPAEKI